MERLEERIEGHERNDARDDQPHDQPDRRPEGQAGRQVFFLVVSLYGWWRWQRSRRLGESADSGAIVPRWAGPAGLAQLAAMAVVGTTVFYYVLRELGSWGPLPDAWAYFGYANVSFAKGKVYIQYYRGCPLLGIAEQNFHAQENVLKIYPPDYFYE